MSRKTVRRPLSIRARFFIVSLIAVPSALALAALFMVSLFSVNLERRLDAELTGHINNIAASLQFTMDGVLQRPDGFLDKRFTEAYGGLYWQISGAPSLPPIRSASLWDYTLTTPNDLPDDGAVHRYGLPGPDNTQLTAQQRQVMIPTPAGLKTLTIVVAADKQPLIDASHTFAIDILPYLAGLAIVLIAASMFQTFVGLRPLNDLTNGLDRIRERRAGRMRAVLPAEFAPAETAINRLLDEQAQSLIKARARAGDLAHGLKTPLTVLSNDALTLRSRGEIEIADEIEHLVQLMRSHVEAELARSRIAANAEMRQSDADMEDIIGQIARTLKRTPKGDLLEWRIEVQMPSIVPLDPQDLRDLVGNITENAVKWAASQVTIVWKDQQLTVTDDGPGVDPERIRSITERGIRLDTKVIGTGLGLSIVQEICRVYGLCLEIENRQGSGLRVCVRF